MLERIVKSVLLGMGASLVSGGIAIFLIVVYVRHLARTTGAGQVLGGVVPCLAIMVAAFLTAFLWIWLRS